MDEVPFNSDIGIGNYLWGRPSGDWQDLNSSGINLMLALTPG